MTERFAAGAADEALLSRPASPTDLERARHIAEQSKFTYAYLVLRADKSVLFSAGGQAFLMYGRRGRSWIAMGDPVGPEEEARALPRRFCDLSARSGGWCVFFEVRPERLALYSDLGLTLSKLGEEARVDLTRFSLEGPLYNKLRTTRARLLRHDCRFEVVPRETVPERVPTLRRISDAWLAGKATREKGFSNASFDERYLVQFPVAVVRHGSEIVAFANVWLGGGREEISVDLMRHVPEAPNGTMDFLFTELLLWGQAEGYRWFNFGMAPLAGLDGRHGSLWHRLGNFLFRHGEHFYNFQGLRHYKAKFHPVWTPLYLASPGGLALPAVVLDVAALVAGGLGGIVLKDPLPDRRRT